MKQQQFLEVLDRDEAERRWREVISVAPGVSESVRLEDALGPAGPAVSVHIGVHCG